MTPCLMVARNMRSVTCKVDVQHEKVDEILDGARLGHVLQASVVHSKLEGGGVLKRNFSLKNFSISLF